MIRFNCDYNEGAHPRILETLVKTNMEQTPGYGEDPYCEKAAKVIKDLCKKEDAAVQESCCCQCSHKTKERSEKEYRDLMNRLKRIEGQVRGIQGMLEKDAYCTDILVQVAAVNAALNSFNKVLLTNHIKTCVTNDIREGREETVDELVTVLQKLMK